jgi:alanine-glyoxylate transaminase/(R)-3-amino-2-methylpropionate-pyruvate transaminase
MYRSPWASEEETVKHRLRELQEVVACNTSGRVAGFMAETMMGAAGFVPHPKGYLKGAHEIIRKAGYFC